MIFSFRDVVIVSRFELRSSRIQEKFNLSSFQYFRSCWSWSWYELALSEVVDLEVDTNLHALRACRSLNFQIFRDSILLSTKDPLKEWQRSLFIKKFYWLYACRSLNFQIFRGSILSSTKDPLNEWQMSLLPIELEPIYLLGLDLD